MNSKQLKQILESPITKGAKGRFISIEELEQIKTILEAWGIIKNTFNILPRYDYNEPEIYILSKDGEKEISQYVSRDEYDKIIKALEVEDEN